MARVKRGVAAHRRHKKVLAQVKDDVDAKVLEFPPTQSGTAAPAADKVEAVTDADTAAGAV